MKNGLVDILLWLLGKLGWKEEVAPAGYDPISVDAAFLTRRITPLVKYWEGKDQSGEYKRHQCYALLVKKFAEYEKVDMALAVERALRQLRGI